MKGEKTAEYDEARSRDYLTFIYDAVAAAAADFSLRRTALLRKTSRLTASKRSFSKTAPSTVTRSFPRHIKPR